MKFLDALKQIEQDGREIAVIIPGEGEKVEIRSTVGISRLLHFLLSPSVFLFYLHGESIELSKST